MTTTTTPETPTTDLLASRVAWFVWNRATFGKTPEDEIARLCRQSGATAVALKAYDGADWYGQGKSFRQSARDLRAAGVPVVLAWGYHYGVDLAGEIARVHECIGYGQADGVILNVEDPVIERDPTTADRWGPALWNLAQDFEGFPLYFCSHAQPSYHESQPYWQAAEAGLTMMPMAYHTAMERLPGDALRTTLAQYQEYELIRGPWIAAGGAYDGPNMRISPAGAREWQRSAMDIGAAGVIWWSLDVARNSPEILDTIGDEWPAVDSQPF